MGKLPLSPRKLVSVIGEVNSQAYETARILIAGTNSEALETVRQALASGADPRATDYLIDVKEVAAGNGFIPSGYYEDTAAVVLVVPSDELNSDELKKEMKDATGAGVHVVLVITESPGLEISFPDAGVGPKRVVGVAADGSLPADVLAEAIADAAGESAVALSAGLPVLRRATCDLLIKRCARQNGVIGVLFIIPGADMPVMTMNQARMILRIAAAHGEKVGVDRAIELLSVVGGGFSFRALARQALNVVPGPGWALKGSVAYSATIAMGCAAKAYFDGSVRVTPSKLTALAEKVKSLRR